jgi:hypothetical protein
MTGNKLEYNYFFTTMRLGTANERILAAVFAAAIFYASVCSTMCTAGVCPNGLQHSTPTDNCDQMPISHSHGPQKNAPDDRDCTMHHYPTVNIVRADNRAKLQLTSAGYISSHGIFIDSTQAVASIPTAFLFSGQASPTLRSSPPQQISPLRI